MPKQSWVMLTHGLVKLARPRLDVGAVKPWQAVRLSGFVENRATHGPHDLAGRGHQRLAEAADTVAGHGISGDKKSSQADSAGSIPVARSTREKRCSISEIEDSSSPLIRVFGQGLDHCGPHISTVQDSSFSFRGRSACSVMISGRLCARSCSGGAPGCGLAAVKAFAEQSGERKHRGASPVNHPDPTTNMPSLSCRAGPCWCRGVMAESWVKCRVQ